MIKRVLKDLTGQLDDDQRSHEAIAMHPARRHVVHLTYDGMMVI